MKKLLFFLFTFLFFSQLSFGEPVDLKQDVGNLSKTKWQWLADKDVTKLETLFHENSKFVHMGGTWKKKEELEIIKSGRIWYKKADLHDQAVELFGNTAIVWSLITLDAEVGGNTVSNRFTVTEVYQQQDGSWKMLDFTFSKVMDSHQIAH
ncbi:MAG: nuclear transport factor 2 family protein [Cellvibrio sp.]|nr:nuclear transport factor 2 family protein [Cellvibrio sp.]